MKKFKLNKKITKHMDDLKIKKIKTKKELKKALKIREIVFIKGQNVPAKRERDGLDNNCIHFLVKYKGKHVGTARIRALNKKEAKFERIAIIKNYRKEGIGSKLVKCMIDYCKKNNFKKISLGAQLHTLNFYKKSGFKPIGKIFMDANIKHKKMLMKLK